MSDTMAHIANTGQSTYKSDLEGIFDTLQEQRSALLTMTRDVQLAARLLAAAEARRLRREVDAGDPRVARYVDNSAAMARRAAALEIEIQIADIRVPPVTKTETLLQGRVTDESIMATAHVTVTLVDEKGAPVAGIAPVETDDSGYYAFILQPAQVEAIGADRKLTLQFASDSGKLVPTAARPFTLQPGQVTVSETSLQASELAKLQLRPAFKELARPAATKAGSATGKGSPAKATPSKAKPPKAKPPKVRR
jgi:hypothetical protein